MSTDPIKCLKSFIDSRPDSRELARALAVKLAKEGYSYRAITQILQVSKGFITKWNNAFDSQGIEGIKLHYKGRKSYLDRQQKEQIINWIICQDKWNVSEIKREIIKRCNVQFKSLQSYYSLLYEAQKNKNY
jgi:transposase